MVSGGVSLHSWHQLYCRIFTIVFPHYQEANDFRKSISYTPINSWSSKMNHVSMLPSIPTRGYSRPSSFESLRLLSQLAAQGFSSAKQGATLTYRLSVLHGVIVYIGKLSYLSPQLENHAVIRHTPGSLNMLIQMWMIVTTIVPIWDNSARMLSNTVCSMTQLILCLQQRVRPLTVMTMTFTSHCINGLVNGILGLKHTFGHQRSLGFACPLDLYASSDIIITFASVSDNCVSAAIKNQGSEPIFHTFVYYVLSQVRIIPREASAIKF